MKEFLPLLAVIVLASSCGTGHDSNHEPMPHDPHTFAKADEAAIRHYL